MPAPISSPTPSITSQKLQQALTAIDAANSKDPNQDAGQAKELLYGRRMSEALNDFEPAASAHLQIAARAQHIERWKSARSDYPEGRTGYKKWRSQLYLFHAQRTGEILQELKFDQGDIDKVAFLIQKRQLRRNAETQTLEDVICLVFLKYYFDDFSQKHAEEKLIDIVQKTWSKMSEKGHQAALNLDYSEKNLDLIKKSLA